MTLILVIIFPIKNQLVMLNNKKDTSLGAGTTLIEYRQQSVSVIRGKDDWLFYGTSVEEEQSVNDYLCNNLYEEDRLKEIAEGYAMLQEKLKESGSELVVLYAANKEQIYSEYMPASLKKGTYSRTEQLVDYIHQNTSVPLLYVKDALLKEKKNHRLFFKYDTHWNNLGGFVGGQLLNEYFHGEYVSLDDVSYSVVSRDKSGDMADLLSMRSSYSDDVVYQIERYKEGVEHTLVEDGGDYYKFTSNAKDQRSVLVGMDSFGYALMSIVYDFGKVTFAQEEKDFVKFYRKEHPDIVVLEIVERKKGTQENWCRELCELLSEEQEGDTKK